MTTIAFTKMVGTGNDFVVIDTRRQSLGLPPRRWGTMSQVLCDRHTGIGADGVLLLEPSRVADVKMRIFNPDGTEAEMCGNGARCVGLYVRETGDRRHETEDGRITIESLAGVLSASVRHHRVAMRMTDPTELQLDVALTLEGRVVRLGCVNTGVPHAVVAVKRLETVDVEQIGRALRRHRHFSPRGTNVNFLQPDRTHRSRIHVRTYERGVEAETLACGTGVVASAIIYALRKKLWKAQDRSAHNGWAHQCTVEVHTRSGDLLTVSFAVTPKDRGLQVAQVILEGTAQKIFEGTVDWGARHTTRRRASMRTA